MAPPAPLEAVEPPARVDQESLRAALADLKAAEGRVERDARRIYDETRAKVVRDLLPIVDNLDRTLHHAGSGGAEATPADSAMVEGVRMVRQQMEQVLERYGVERVRALGERFDPSVHEAIATMPVSSDRVGLVVQEAEAGYQFGGKVLRAAKVIVGAA